MCLFDGCRSQYGLVEGYCRMHAQRRKLSSASSPPTELNSSQKKNVKLSNNDLGTKMDKMTAKMDELIATVNILQSENLELNNQVGDLHAENDVLKTVNSDLKVENNVLKTRLNKLFFKNDAINQYGRHESFRIYNAKEPAKGSEDNSLTHVKNVGEKMGLMITEDDIQRCHRLGKPKTDGTPRAIVCKLKSFPLKKSIMRGENKRKLRPDLTGKSIGERKEILKNTVFVAEDLSPFRGKIFRYVRAWNEENKAFDVVSSHYGKIVCKVKGEDNEWKHISSTEDFFEIGIPYDEKFKSEFDEIFHDLE